MPVTINGDGTITGLAVGGLPDGSVDADTLASNSVTTNKIANSQVTSGKLASGAATPADGSITTAKLASGAITKAVLPAGTVLDFQHYQSVGDISHGSNTFADMSGYSLNLTPRSGSKVLIGFGAPKGASTTNPVRFKVVRTKSGTATDLGMSTTNDWQGNRATMANYVGGDNSNQIFHVNFNWVDNAPGGDGSTTINYKLQWAIAGGTAYLGKSDPASVQQRSGGSQFFVMEIAG